MVQSGNARGRLQSVDVSVASYGMGSYTVDHEAMGPVVPSTHQASQQAYIPDKVSVQTPTSTGGGSNGQKNGGSGQPTIKRYTPSLPEPKREDPGSGTYWRCYTLFATLLIPDCLICRPDEAAKQAWREKMAIFQIFMMANVIFLFFFGLIPIYFCREEDNFLSRYRWYQSIIDETCDAMSYASYALIFLVAGLLALQCICSMLVGLKSFYFRISDIAQFDHKKMDDPIMIMVPCYNEGDKELGKTITSVLESTYNPDNRVLFVIADGIVTGRGEYVSTPGVLAHILGFTLDGKRDQAYSYKSLGSGENKASVYSGIMERKGNTLKYVVVVKRGTSAEKESSKPGNRGKRDSQLITLGLLNRLHHDRRLSDLDKALVAAFDSLGLPVKDMKYMLALDADTRISSTSITHMVYSMNQKKSVLACCGETRVDNKTASWVTMIQIYEYFASHHLKKSFESVFGTVTCLPGCFTMYRIITEDLRSLIASDTIYQNYARNDIDSLHDKNLYHLGEDRMLTTLLLKYFPDMSLSFVPIACCWTVVPDEFKVLLSQRRRWINSTFHNMWELMKVRIRCGFCCISMNAVVLCDIIFFLILPSGLIYTFAYTYTVIADGKALSLVSVVLYGVLIGVQMIIFLVRSRFDFILWFLIYVVIGVPVFYFILPIYSFWNMDDFSWGTTRQVATTKSNAGAARASPKPSTPAQSRVPIPVHEDRHRERQHQRMNTGSDNSETDEPSPTYLPRKHAPRHEDRQISELTMNI